MAGRSQSQSRGQKQRQAPSQKQSHAQRQTTRHRDDLASLRTESSPLLPFGRPAGQPDLRDDDDGEASPPASGVVFGAAPAGRRVAALIRSEPSKHPPSLKIESLIDPVTERARRGELDLMAILKYVFIDRQVARDIEASDLARLFERLRIPHDEKIPVEDGDAITRKNLGEGPLKDALVRLPDGALIPVNQLWKAERRGAKSKHPDPLGDVPIDVLICALFRAFEHERLKLGGAVPDATEGFGESLAGIFFDKLQELGHDLESSPDGTGMKRLRERLNRGRPEPVMPNMKARQARYNLGEPAIPRPDGCSDHD